jgi:phage tail sheath protein FI
VIPESVYQLLPLRVAPALGLQASVFASGSTAVSAQAGSFIRNVKLEGAFDYQPATTSILDARKRGFLAALEQMEAQDIAFLILPGLTYGNNLFQEVFDVAKEQVENATVESGLRIALFDAPIGVSERQVAPLTASINRERVKLIVGHSTTRSLNGKTYPQVGSSGKAAGLMAVRPPRISVASTYGNFLIQNVSSVDTKSTPEYYKIVSQGHADMLYYDAGIRAYKFLNGITTSYDPNRRYDSVRRLMDQLISDLYQSLQWVRSEPNTRELQRRVSASVDARLQQGLRNGDLIRVAPTVCGPENNSEADMIAGRLNIAIRLTPVVPADFIGASVVRDLTENFSLQTVSSVPAF